MDRLRPLWDFDDLDLSERRLTEQLDREADNTGRAEVLTQLARVEGLRGAFDRCGDLLDEAARLGAGRAIVDVRVALERGRMLAGRAATGRRVPGLRDRVRAGRPCRRALPGGRRGAHGGARRAGRRGLSRLDYARDRARRARACSGLLAGTAPEQALSAGRSTRKARTTRRSRSSSARSRFGKKIKPTSTRSRSRATRSPSPSARSDARLTRRDQAERAVAWSVRSGRRDPYFHEELAEDYAALGRVDDAAEHARRALEYFGSDVTPTQRTRLEELSGLEQPTNG